MDFGREKGVFPLVLIQVKSETKRTVFGLKNKRKKAFLSFKTQLFHIQVVRYAAEGKEHVNFMRLRHHDRVKYFIYHALKREVPNARSWSELRLALRRYGIDTQWKLSRTTGEMEGVKFTCNQQTFSGSKIDRQFSFLNIDQELRYNALSATMNLHQVQAETIREEPRHEYQQENHSSISLGLFTPSPTDYDKEEAIQANRLKKKKKKPKRKRGFSL